MSQKSISAYLINGSDHILENIFLQDGKLVPSSGFYRLLRMASITLIRFYGLTAIIFSMKVKGQAFLLKKPASLKQSLLKYGCLND